MRKVVSFYETRKDKIMILIAIVPLILVLVLWVWNEHQKTKRAVRKVFFAKWNLCCERILLWKLHNKGVNEESILEFQELWEEQEDLAEDFENLGGDPKEVNFWLVHGATYLKYS